MRQELKAESEKYGVKLSFMPFFIKATSMALEKYPILNSTLDEENFTVTHKVSEILRILLFFLLAVIVCAFV